MTVEQPSCVLRQGKQSCVLHLVTNCIFVQPSCVLHQGKQGLVIKGTCVVGYSLHVYCI